jgi:hypothetical protein
MATNNDSNSYPPTNPSGSFTRTIAPIMSIIRSMADILVTMPRIRNIPPITSNRPISRASSGGSPCYQKSPASLQYFQTLVIHVLKRLFQLRF